MQREYQRGEPLVYDVAPAVVRQLVAEDVPEHFGAVLPVREHQRGAEYPHEHGRGDGAGTDKAGLVLAGHGEVDDKIAVGRLALGAAYRADEAFVARYVPRGAYNGACRPHEAPEAPRGDGAFCRAPYGCEYAAALPVRGRGRIIFVRLPVRHSRILVNGRNIFFGGTRQYPGDVQTVRTRRRRALHRLHCRGRRRVDGGGHKTGQRQYEAQQHNEPCIIIKAAGQTPAEKSAREHEPERHNGSAETEIQEHNEKTLHFAPSPFRSARSSSMSASLSSSDCTSAATSLFALPR